MAVRSSCIVVALAVFAAHVAAYPTPIDHVSGEDNYFRNGLRNSPSRELDRFMAVSEWDGLYGKTDGHVTTTKQDSSLDRLGGGHVMRTKRDDSLDRLGGFISFTDNCDDDDDISCGSGGASPPFAAVKRASSLNRLDGGHIIEAKWDSNLDRLGDYVMEAKRDNSLDRLGGGHVMEAKRDSSLDRLGGGRVMGTKRDSSLDRLGGGHVMEAKRDSSLDRLGGGHVMETKRDSSLDRLDGGHVIGAKRDGGRPSAPLGDKSGLTVGRLGGLGGLLAFVRPGDGPSAGRQPPGYRWIEVTESDYVDCLDCVSPAESSF